MEEVDEDGNKKRQGYAYKRLPMGTTFSPEVMQAVVQAMANIVQDEVFSSSQQQGMNPIVHIDNVRFLANTKREAAFYQDRWLRLCKEVKAECGLSEKDPLHEPHQSGDFLGLAYDYTEGKITLGKKSLTKLRRMREQLNNPDSFTLRDMAKLFGICSFASRALRYPTAAHFAIFKYVRRRAAGIIGAEKPMWEQAANIWRSIIPEWKQWCDNLLVYKPVSHPNPDSTEHTFQALRSAGRDAREGGPA